MSDFTRYLSSQTKFGHDYSEFLGRTTNIMTGKQTAMMFRCPCGEVEAYSTFSLGEIELKK